MATLFINKPSTKGTALKKPFERFKLPRFQRKKIAIFNQNIFLTTF